MYLKIPIQIKATDAMGKHTKPMAAWRFLKGHFLRLLGVVLVAAAILKTFGEGGGGTGGSVSRCLRRSFLADCLSLCRGFARFVAFIDHAQFFVMVGLFRRFFRFFRDQSKFGGRGTKVVRVFRPCPG